MRKGWLLIVAAAAAMCLSGCSGTTVPGTGADAGHGDGTNDPTGDPANARAIVWQGKGIDWKDEIRLVRRPAGETEIVTHGQGPSSACKAPDYAVEVSESLIYTGEHGQGFTSFSVEAANLPSVLPGVSAASSGGLKGLQAGKAYGGMSQVVCMTAEQWAHARRDTSNTYTITVTAFPYDDSKESFSLKTAQ